jgi:hypothetical protein
MYKFRDDYEIPKEGYQMSYRNCSGFPPKKWKFYADKDKCEEIDREVKEFCERIDLEPKNWLHTIRAYFFYTTVMFRGDQYVSQVISYEHNQKVIERDDFYPVVIRIGPYASKREIVDYINKLYMNEIEPIQNKYKKVGASIGKVKTRNKYFRDDFIYKNSELPHREIAKMVFKEFKEHLDVGLIGKIISLEKKRRKNM